MWLVLGRLGRFLDCIADGRVLGWNNEWVRIKGCAFRREGGESLVVARQRIPKDVWWSQ